MNRRLFLDALQRLPDPNFRRSLRKELEVSAHAMTQSTAPPGFSAVTLYMKAPPNRGHDFLAFLEKAFGAETGLVVPRPDGSLMHAEVRIGNSMLEVADGTEEYPARPAALHLYVPDVDAVYEAAKAAGVTTLGELGDRPYGDREVDLRDPFGNYWYVATHKGPRYVMEPLRDLTPYLHVNGAARLIGFLKEAFAAEEVYVGTGPEGRVVHAKIRLDDTVIEMSDGSENWPAGPVSLHYYVRDVDEAHRRAIASGGISRSEPSDKPYGERNSEIIDPAGNSWYLAAKLQP